MENKWIPLLVIIVIGFLYYGFKDDYKGDPKELIKKVIEASLGTVASFFFGLFGFNFELFIEQNERKIFSKKG